MKLKAGILIPVVSGPFSSEETAHWWEKSHQEDSETIEWGSAIPHKRREPLEIFRWLILHGFPKSKDLTHTGHN